MCIIIDMACFDLHIRLFIPYKTVYFYQSQCHIPSSKTHMKQISQYKKILQKPILIKFLLTACFHCLLNFSLVLLFFSWCNAKTHSKANDLIETIWRTNEKSSKQWKHAVKRNSIKIGFCKIFFILVYLFHVCLRRRYMLGHPL
jgi:hypothetical protein